ncbi:leucine rich repeat domain protein [Dictyocaulus viviparus]|uniref:Leucine rich repeat domain protein n=1 Tax=Dictyocaulus viviparus TaxID=29172 RepID=A0A0D8Y0D0_DICVI|nr:leucine rich repeat domain protein [Dictyocaulus viviparus]
MLIIKPITYLLRTLSATTFSLFFYFLIQFHLSEEAWNLNTSDHTRIRIRTTRNGQKQYQISFSKCQTYILDEMLLFLLLGLLAIRTTACPPQCSCTDFFTDCSSRGLHLFPKNLSTSTITLNLRGNNIGRISIDDVKSLKYMETLIISENHVKIIDEVTLFLLLVLL